jgi:hypothetical protein
MPTASVAQRPNEWDKARAELQKWDAQLAAKSKEIDAMPNGADKSERAREWLVEYDAFEKARKEYNAELAQNREQWLREGEILNEMNRQMTPQQIDVHYHNDSSSLNNDLGTPLNPINVQAW